jgi:hypothetical protein
MSWSWVSDQEQFRTDVQSTPSTICCVGTLYRRVRKGPEGQERMHLGICFERKS